MNLWRLRVCEMAEWADHPVDRATTSTTSTRAIYMRKPNTISVSPIESTHGKIAVAVSLCRYLCNGPCIEWLVAATPEEVRVAMPHVHPSSSSSSFPVIYMQIIQSSAHRDPQIMTSCKQLNHIHPSATLSHSPSTS